MIYVYARFRQVADSWSRDQGLSPSQCILISDAQPRESVKYEAGDRVVILGAVAQRTLDHIERVGRKSSTVAIEHWEC